MNPYLNCPTFETKQFIIRLICEEDYKSLFDCYNDKSAVEFTNDDNCDFDFYVDSKEEMKNLVLYWLDFYNKRGFIRFSIVDKLTEKAVGTIEGFNGETGVLRIDICAKYEKTNYLTELFEFSTANFHTLFGNEYLVTKAIPKATARRLSLQQSGWEYIGQYKTYQDYYKIKLP